MDYFLKESGFYRPKVLRVMFYVRYRLFVVAGSSLMAYVFSYETLGVYSCNHTISQGLIQCTRLSYEDPAAI